MEDGRWQSTRLVGRLLTLGARSRDSGVGFKAFRGRIEQSVPVLQFVLDEPVGVSVEQQGEVMELVLEFAIRAGTPGQRAESGGRELMLLQFTEQLAELLGETGASGAGAEQFQFAFVPQQQRAQDHHPPFLGEQPRRPRDAQRIEDKLREPLERKNVQARISGQSPGVKQLAFELKRRLLGRKQDQRRAFRRRRQGGADFGEAAERLAAAGRPEEKMRLHALLFAQCREIARQFIVKFWQGVVGGRPRFLFPFVKIALLLSSVGETPIG